MNFTKKFENYEKNNLEDYEIKSFKKISNDLFSTLENVFGIDNLLDHVFNITNTPYEYTYKLMNIYIFLVYIVPYYLHHLLLNPIIIIGHHEHIDL